MSISSGIRFNCLFLNPLGAVELSSPSTGLQQSFAPAMCISVLLRPHSVCLCFCVRVLVLCVCAFVFVCWCFGLFFYVCCARFCVFVCV
jgi:hypothetical protein